jgi:hypothetical protein
MQLLSVFLAIVALAPAPAATSSKPSWDWSPEERISARLNPDQVRQRIESHRSRQKSGRAGAVVSASVVDSATFVIDGAHHPALFMPWELMERLLNSTDPSKPAGASLRQSYTDDLVAAGWSTATFWSDFDEISMDYLAAREHGLRQPLQRGSSGREAAMGGTHRRLCHTRAEALRLAREKFGREAFDRFLYEAVAPRVVVYADEPMTASQLRYLEEGCR